MNWIINLSTFGNVVKSLGVSGTDSSLVAVSDLDHEVNLGLFSLDIIAKICKVLIG